MFYINGRYIKSSLISKAIEEGYREYLMQHKFPFCVLHFQIDTERIDVNVHPTKMEVRIADGPVFYETVKETIHRVLREQEMIPMVSLTEEPKEKQAVKAAVPEPFESRRIAAATAMPERTAASAAIQQIYEKSRPQEMVAAQPKAAYATTTLAGSQIFDRETKMVQTETVAQPEMAAKPEQLELFDDRLLSAKAREHYEILGQLFETYWLISYQDKLLIIDQHAAHEKVKYERFMKRFREHSIVSQTMNPPMIVTLNGKEKECYEQHREDFEALGFVIEEFGGNDYAIRGVPLDLYGYEESEFFYEILDELGAESVTGTPEGIRIRIATMACKAAVKGNMRLSLEEAQRLIDELLTLDNPYNCPHGRPTIISMSKYEIEKKFKRIVT